MTKSIIVAKTENHVIGQDDRLPWHLPQDLQNFKRVTMGHHVILGRKTFASLKTSLTGRELIVVTRSANYHATGCTTVHSIPEAFAVAEQSGETEVFIAGGEKIYRATLALADKIYLTAIKARLNGDTFFPMLKPEVWKEVTRIHHPADAHHRYAYDFVELVRRDIA